MVLHSKPGPKYKKVHLELGNRLRKSAVRMRQQMAERVSGPQKGVPTFHDNYLSHFISRMTDLFPKDDWASSWKKVQHPEGLWVKREVTRLQLTLAAQNQGRFVTLDERRLLAEADSEQTVLRAPFGEEIARHDMTMSQGRAECLQWKGMPLFKTVYDFSLMSMLIWETKPRTIIELGSGSGASALWMADLAKSYDLECRVLSLDINKPDLDVEGVEYIEGDCNKIADYFPTELLAALPHPWIVVEDAHVNVEAIIEYFASSMQKGDYLIVEDSRVDKMGVLEKWARANSEKFRVDTKYTDFFGRNATCSPDSIFARL